MNQLPDPQLVPKSLGSLTFYGIPENLALNGTWIDWIRQIGTDQIKSASITPASV
jgi:hypothetical protein